MLWSETARHMLAEGHEVLASVKKWPVPAPQVESLKALGVVLVEREWVNATRAAFWQARLRRRPVTQPGYEPAWTAIHQFKPDLVCVSHGANLCGLDWMRRCHREGMPYASITQANSEQWWPNDDAREEIAETFSAAQKTYFVSQANLKLFERQIARHLPNAEVVANPFNVDWNSTPDWPPHGDAWRLACVGRLDPRAKGQDLILEVLAMPKWKRRPLKVALYGKGEFDQSLRRLASFLSVEEQVEIVGHVNDVIEVWERNHALLLPSRFEGLPLCIVEAMMCGRIAITTDVAGNREPIVDNVTGFIAGAATVEHLDTAMERAWNMRHEWRTMGVAAAESIRNRVPRNPAQTFAERLLTL